MFVPWGCCAVSVVAIVGSDKGSGGCCGKKRKLTATDGNTGERREGAQPNEGVEIDSGQDAVRWTRR
jgi:hypothetical protein